MSNDIGTNIGKRVICVSWQPTLALTRQLLLSQLGCRVVSALGHQEALESCQETAALMIIGHSVPQEEKRQVIQCFRRHCLAPVLSLLRPGQEKLPEATHGVESSDPLAFMDAVTQILK